jgi:mannose-1-phosphate guanylyltransferase
MQIILVIPLDGSSTGLWPLSHKQYPKQYLPLVGDNPILHERILCFKDVDFLERCSLKRHNWHMLSILNWLL